MCQVQVQISNSMHEQAQVVIASYNILQVLRTSTIYAWTRTSTKGVVIASDDILVLHTRSTHIYIRMKCEWAGRCCMSIVIHVWTCACERGRQLYRYMSGRGGSYVLSTGGQVQVRRRWAKCRVLFEILVRHFRFTCWSILLLSEAFRF